MSAFTSRHYERASAKLDSTLTTTETRQEKQRLRDGEREIVYVTPERLESPAYVALLREAGVSLFVVDEAHCLATWGHDFRPAFSPCAQQHFLRSEAHAQ